MITTHEKLLEAFQWFTEQPAGSFSVYYAARKFDVHYELLRGALMLHNQCPPPKHAGKQPSPKPTGPRPPRGRPPLPLLGPEDLQALREWIESADVFIVATQLNMGWTDVRKVADGKRGLGEKHLERLKRRTDYLSRERARVDGEITPPASGNRGAPSALTLEIAESVKHQRGGHMELNDQGEQIWITCK